MGDISCAGLLTAEIFWMKWRPSLMEFFGASDNVEDPVLPFVILRQVFTPAVISCSNPLKPLMDPDPQFDLNFIKLHRRAFDQL